MKTTGIRTSRSISKIAPAFIAAQGKFPLVRKASTNEQYSNKFANRGDVIKATRKILNREGLAVLQAPTKTDMENSTVTIATRLLHTSGQFMESDFEMPVIEEAWANGAITGQVMLSALTYACRGAYKAFLCIAEKNDDDDGNAASIPSEYRRKDGKRPGTHPEIIKGELIEIRPGEAANTHYARCVGVPPKLFILDAGIRSQLEKAVRETVELECLKSDCADYWQVVRILRIGRFDFTEVEGQFAASVAHVTTKHNLEPPAPSAEIPEPF